MAADLATTPEAWADPLRKLDAVTERAARAFMARLDGRYDVREAFVYGSRARGSHRPDSDADLAVVLVGEAGDRWGALRDMAGIAFDVLLETEVLVEALPLWEGELCFPDRFRNPALLREIRREGIRL